MPTEWIHHPWDAPRTLLKASGVELGLNYPQPIIEFDTARDQLDDAVNMMWQLDRASRVAKLSGLEEVVADNLISLNTFDIPKVIVKEEVFCSSSSLDQKVPSLHNMKDSSVKKKPKDVSGKRSDLVGSCSPMNILEKSNIDVDLLSTAKSSSARKRSISESQCAVPICFSSGCTEPCQEYDSVDQNYSNTSHSDHPCQETYQIGEKKEEEDFDAQSSLEGSRPCKKTA